MRKVVHIFVLTLFLGTLSQRALGETPSIDLQVSRDTLVMGENLEVRINIKGGSALTTPEIPPLGNFDVVGQSSGNSIEIINGQMSVTNTFHYILEPRKEGKLLIGPVKAHIDGKTYSAGPLTITVLPSEKTPPYIPSQPQFVQPGIPQTPLPSPYAQSLPPAASKAETFVTAETDKVEAYVGEQILYAFRLYTSVEIQNAQLKLPEFKDFITEELIQDRKYETELNGRRYAVNEWRLAIFPTKAGNLNTGPTSVRGIVPGGRLPSPFSDPFFQGAFSRKRRKLERIFSAPGITIAVKELPPAPPGFTGLVGEFSIVSRLSQDVLQMGDTANLEVEIKGKGNISEAVLPSLGDTPYFKVYPGKSKLDLDKSLSGLQGKKTFSFALVGERPGETTIPSWDLYYFDPQNASFERINTPVYSIKIQGSAKGEKLVTAGIEKSEDLLAAPPKVLDLRDLKPTEAVLTSQRLPLWQKILWMALGVFSALAFIIYLLVEKGRERALAQAEDRKRSKAFKNAKMALAKLKQGKADEDFSQITRILKKYLSDRFLIKGGALTPVEVEGLLKENNIPEQSLRRMVTLLEQLDSWKYGGMREGILSQRDLKKDITDLLREIEKAA